MTIRDVARHDVSEQRIEQALKDIESQADAHWLSMRYGDYTDDMPHRMRDDLLDHVAARTVADPEPGTAPSGLVLRTAAQCAMGIMSMTCFPHGDQEIHYSLIRETLSSDEMVFGEYVEEAASAATWLDAFALSVISGIIWEREQAIGVLLRHDYAVDIHQGLPASHLDPVLEPGELAEMDALCGYLTPPQDHLPAGWPSVTLCRPADDERTQAIRKLDALEDLTPDQRLLRALLEDDQPVFERALEARLVQHQESTPADAPPRSLLPHKTIALAALAVQVHGWDLSVGSAYLPQALLVAPEGAPPVAG